MSERRAFPGAHWTGSLPKPPKDKHLFTVRANVNKLIRCDIITTTRWTWWFSFIEVVEGLTDRHLDVWRLGESLCFYFNLYIMTSFLIHFQFHLFYEKYYFLGWFTRLLKLSIKDDAKQKTVWRSVEFSLIPMLRLNFFHFTCSAHPSDGRSKAKPCSWPPVDSGSQCCGRSLCTAGLAVWGWSTSVLLLWSPSQKSGGV